LRKGHEAAAVFVFILLERKKQGCERTEKDNIAGVLSVDYGSRVLFKDLMAHCGIRMSSLR
jgi:hypothetical protein